MRTLTRRIFAMVLPVFAGAALLGCEEAPTTVEQKQQAMDNQEVAASHGSSAVASASAVYRAVKSTAAQNHGFRQGERIGTLSVTDDGSSLTVEGSASGMDPTGIYVSLFYDKRSSAQGIPSSDNAATNAGACEPGGFGGDHPQSLTLGQMEIGSGGTLDLWDVAANGDATLGPTTTVEYVSVKKIGTVSIRDARVNGGFGPNAVVACGVVTHDPASATD